MKFVCTGPIGVEKMVEWAAAEGWNPGLHDARTFYQCDSQGFWLAEVEDQPVACISAVSWNPDFAFIGLYIARPQMRGRGYGYALWKYVLEQHAGKCLALDGVVAQQANYARSGFTLAHRSLRWAGRAGQLEGGHPAFIRPEAALVEDLDESVSPASRPNYRRAWLAQPEARVLATPDGSALGVARPCRQGWKVGPLIAPDAELAGGLLSACCAGLAADTPVFVDVPEPNQAGNRLLEKLGFTVSFEVARMYTRPVRPHRLDRLFGVTSFELG